MFLLVFVVDFLPDSRLGLWASSRQVKLNSRKFGLPGFSFERIRFWSVRRDSRPPPRFACAPRAAAKGSRGAA